MDLDAAVDAAVDEMPEAFVIREIIIANRAEVKAMLFTEYNEEKIMEKKHQEGYTEGVNQERERVAVAMIKEDNLSASFISRISLLSEGAVRKLANKTGVLL